MPAKAERELQSDQNSAMNRKTSSETKRIIITDEKHGLPYSKGLTASAVMSTGLPPLRSYFVAKQVEEQLRRKGIYALTVEQLRAIVYEVLETQSGREYADKYLKWQALVELDLPLIIMIGGTTGVGKSTIATEIAHRLGITRIVATDAIREVMRALFSEELMPTLYSSSFDAWQSLRPIAGNGENPVIAGFVEQTRAVVVGVRAIVDRAIREGTHLVLEGVHIVPGMVDFRHDNALIAPLVIGVEDEELHRSHFYIREKETDGSRAFERYRANFAHIRSIGRFIEESARDQGVPLIFSHQLDATVSSVLENITNQIILPQENMKAAPIRGR